MDELERNRREREREEALRKQLEGHGPGAAEGVAPHPLSPEALDAIQRARDLADRDPDAPKR